MAAFSPDNEAIRSFKEDAGAGRHFTDGLESAVEQLNKLGVRIDIERIGLIGFSHGGRTILNTMVQSNLGFGAAVIGDAAPVGPMMYYLSAGWPIDIGAVLEQWSKGYPYGDGLDNWNKYNPVMNLDKITAAVRIENYWRPGVLGWYDTFSVLKRLGVPVEYYTYDGSAHNPRNPTQRFVSQQATVDWMRFWLRREEDLNPAKREQYIAWRKLRERFEKAKAQKDVL